MLSVGLNFSPSFLRLEFLLNLELSELLGWLNGNLRNPSVSTSLGLGLHMHTAKHGLLTWVLETQIQEFMLACQALYQLSRLPGLVFEWILCYFTKCSSESRPYKRDKRTVSGSWKHTSVIISDPYNRSKM